MIVIRKEQMDHFSKVAEDTFVAMMVEYLQSEFPDELTELNLEEKNLPQFVHSGIDAAKKYEIRFEYDVQRYLACMLILGADFDASERTGWAAKILRRNDIDGEDKMDAIEFEMYSRAEGEAADG